MVKKQKYDAEFRVFNEADRKTIAAILVTNGYDVGMHKRRREGRKANDYYLHITDNTGGDYSEIQTETSGG